jgi:predicted acylesterase/phospholipase RssA
MRPLFNFLSAASAATFGVPVFFVPRMPPPFVAADGSMAALGFYDTEPLRTTLEELVDFDRINRNEVRLSLGVVSVRSGNSVYFDNRKMRIGPEHVMSSGALPPGFPPVEVDGELYWDGGIASNTPLWYVADEDYRMSYRSTCSAAQARCPGTCGRWRSARRTFSMRAKRALTRLASRSSRNYARHCAACLTSCHRRSSPIPTCSGSRR